ncbi:MAG TPA: hypothetical protein VGP93_18695, partial [Polyangiaceae bacterium]|nr:hypothetical protein [Polyangiaceae bacterium]
NCNFTGSTTVVAGELYVQGGLTGGTIHVHDQAALDGPGNLGILDIQTGGKFYPRSGSSAGGPSTFASGSSVIVFIGAGGYDQLSVNGNVNLVGDAVLHSFLKNGYTPPVGTVFEILKFTGTLSGTFKGLPTGSTFTDSGTIFKIDYADKAVTLTVMCPITDAVVPTVSAPLPATVTQTKCI